MSDFNRVKQLFSAVYWPWVGFVSARFLVVFPCLLATGEKKRDISAVLSIGADQEKLKEDPELMFLGLALYEFLINKLQHWDSGMPPYMMVDLLKSRKETREAIGLLKDISANKAINQLYSMSKSMGFANSQEKIEESAEVAARRDVVEKYKARVTLLLKKLKSQQDADKNQKAVEVK